MFVCVCVYVIDGVPVGGRAFLEVLTSNVSPDRDRYVTHTHTHTQTNTHTHTATHTHTHRYVFCSSSAAQL